MAEITLQTKAIKIEVASIVTPGFIVPANATGVGYYTINLDPVEVMDKTRSLWFHIDEFDFLKMEWRHMLGWGWFGGVNQDPEFFGIPNLISWPEIARLAGKTIRLRIEQSKSQKIGFSFKVVTP